MYHLKYNIPGNNEIRFYFKHKEEDSYDWFYSICDAWTFDYRLWMNRTDDDNYVIITEELLSSLLREICEEEKEERRKLEVMQSVLIGTEELVEAQEQKILEVRDELEELSRLRSMAERLSIQIEYMEWKRREQPEYPYESIAIRLVDLKPQK